MGDLSNVPKPTISIVWVKISRWDSRWSSNRAQSNTQSHDEPPNTEHCLMHSSSLNGSTDDGHDGRGGDAPFSAILIGNISTERHGDDTPEEHHGNIER